MYNIPWLERPCPLFCKLYLFIKPNEKLLQSVKRRGKERICANLLPDIITAWAQKLYKNRNSAMVNDNSCMLWCSRCNIGQGPCSFKLRPLKSSIILVSSNRSIKTKRYRKEREQNVSRNPTCNWGRSCLPRNSTNLGTTPALITSSIGGLRSAHKFKSRLNHNGCRTERNNFWLFQQHPYQ